MQITPGNATVSESLTEFRTFKSMDLSAPRNPSTSANGGHSTHSLHDQKFSEDNGGDRGRLAAYNAGGGRTNAGSLGRGSSLKPGRQISVPRKPADFTWRMSR